MPLPRITFFCPICGGKITGRLDKRFCSSTCRSRYFRIKREESIYKCNRTDAVLHKNWKVLSELHATTGKKKFFIELSQLVSKGFHPEYYTSSSVNSEQKRYYFVYDFGWMQFSEKSIMVVKLNQPK